MSFDFGAVAGSVLEAAAQATATITILNHQKEQYDDIAKERVRLMGESVDHFIHLLRIQMGNSDKIRKNDKGEYVFTTGTYNKDHDRFLKAFGEKPKHAAYEEIDTAALGRNAAEDSLHGLPAAQRYIEASNRIMEQESIVRAIVLDGRYLCVEDVVSCTISDLINGHLPVGDVIEIVKDEAERAAMQGRIGNTHALTTRDLGISRLRAKTAGMKMHFEHLGSLNQNVHRVGDRVAISDFLQKPAERLGFALAQAQLIQQSLQNKYNIDASGDPMQMAKLQAKMQEAIMVLGTEAQRGNMINQFVPNYAALLAPAISTLTDGLLQPGSGEYKTSDTTVPQMTGASVDQRSGK